MANEFLCNTKSRNIVVTLWDWVGCCCLMRVLLFLLIQLLLISGCSSPVMLQWCRPPSPPRGGCSPCLLPANCNTPGNNRIPQSVTLPLKQPAPSTQQAGRQATDCPSTVLLMTLGFQEPAAALTPIHPGV